MRILNLNLDENCGKNTNITMTNPVYGHLFVRFKSNAVVLTKSGYMQAKPGDYIFYHKHETMHYTSFQDEEFVHDFVRFEILGDDQKYCKFPTATLLKIPFSEKMESLLNMLAIEYFSPSELRTESLHLIGLLFLVSVSEHLIRAGISSQQSSKYPHLLDIRLDIYRTPQQRWTVDEMAKRTMVSPSYFQHIYKQAFGITPINDVIQARINMAENLLLFSDKNESEIAALCGYNNVEHFVRQFRKYKRITPSCFRANSKSPQQ